MPNPNYLKGRRLEQKLVRDAKAKGLIALRSAGSKSPIDVVIIDPYKLVIKLIQCKVGTTDGYKEKLEYDYRFLNYKFKVGFEVK